MLNFLSSSVIGTIVVKALSALGIGFVSYLGFDLIMTQISEQVQFAIGSMPDLAINVLGLLGIDIYISYVLSAFTTVFFITARKKIFS